MICGILLNYVNMKLFNLFHSLLLHYGKSLYFSFVSNSLSIKNKDALCDYVGMCINKTDSIFHGIFGFFQGSFK